MPGYRDAHVYPLTPDLAKARALAQGKARTAVLYTCDLSPCAEQAQIVKTDLAAIGLHVAGQDLPVRTLYRPERNGQASRSTSPARLGTDYPDPAGTAHPMLDDSRPLPDLR